MLDRYHTEKLKLSFVLFDEIEKASDALWNLLLGILDKGVLTLGDNRRVDFSSSIIFLTSNLGAGEMSSLITPRLGFRISSRDDDTARFSARIERTGLEAARRKFAPEFINRLDKVVVFKSLGSRELRRIVDIELEMVQQRILASTASKTFRINVTEARSAVLADGGYRFQVWSAPSEARHRAPARTTAGESHGDGPDSPRRPYRRDPQRGFTRPELPSRGRSC